jgi:hypothetical protein
MKMKRLRVYKDGEAIVSDRYLIPENGKYLRDKKTGKKAFPYPHQGYMVITIRIGNLWFSQIKMCQLQWMACRGEILEGFVVHHKRFSKDKEKNQELKFDDNINNLNCMSKSKHARLHNLGSHHSKESKKKVSKANSGERSSCSKLNNSQVGYIRILSYIYCWKSIRIAEELNVSRGCVDGIVQGRNWNPRNLTKQELIIQCQ